MTDIILEQTEADDLIGIHKRAEHDDPIRLLNLDYKAP